MISVDRQTCKIPRASESSGLGFELNAEESCQALLEPEQEPIVLRQTTMVIEFSIEISKSFIEISIELY